MGFDANWWGLITMPIGLLVCFGPAVIVWLRAERDTRESDRDQDR